MRGDPLRTIAVARRQKERAPQTGRNGAPSHRSDELLPSGRRSVRRAAAHCGALERRARDVFAAVGPPATAIVVRILCGGWHCDHEQGKRDEG